MIFSPGTPSAPVKGVPGEKNHAREQGGRVSDMGERSLSWMVAKEGDFFGLDNGVHFSDKRHRWRGEGTFFLSVPRITTVTTDALEAKLVAKLCWASNDGCPVAGQSEERWSEMASIARRRWFSFERRKPKKIEDNRTNRAEDLARGLCEKCERGGLRLAGPLISDYRWLAEQLAEVFLAEPNPEVREQSENMNEGHTLMITTEEMMDFLFMRRAQNLPPAGLAEVFCRLLWCMDDNGSEIAQGLPKVGCER